MAAGLAALAVAFVVWRTAARSARSAPIAKRSAAATATAERKPDPRHAARAQIAGHVTAAGKPVAGAHVCADASGIGVLGRDAICTDTDASGAYALVELLTADYMVSADARGMRPASAHQHLDAGAHATIDLAMKTGGVELAGTVADIGGGPIAHAQLRSGGVVVESDDAGHFSLWVDGGDVSISASADGYAPADWNGHAPDKPELRLQPESSLEGTVIGKDGEPVAGVKVAIEGLDWRQGSVETTTEDDGTFHADRLSPGRYTITARSPHAYGVSDGSVLVSLAEHTDGVVVTVVPAFQVAGKLAGPDGKPCDGWLHLVDEDHGRTLDGWGEASGAVEVDGVLPGTYKVTANCTGFISKEAGTIEIKDRDLVAQTWTVEAGATIKGKVTLTDGTPVDGANVRFQGAGWGNATTNADGTYRVDGLPAGSYQATIVAQHGLQTTQDALEVAERDTVVHDFEIVAGGTVKGVVVDTRGAPVAGALVRLRDIYTSVTTSADGSFVLEPLPEGEHDLAVMVADRFFYRPGTEPDADEPVGHVSVEAGHVATTRLVIELENSAITGVVVDGTGAPVRDAYVDLTASGSEPCPPILTGDDGAFRFPAVKNARYRVHAYVAGRGEGFEDAEAGDKVQIKIEAGEITGIVRGAPEELTVQITGAAYRTETFFHTGGRFAIHDLRPGTYDVMFDTESGHAERTSFQVVDGASDPLDIELEPVFTLTGRVVRSDTHAPVTGVDVLMRVGYARFPESGEVLTDGAGRFTIKRAHKGQAEVRLASPDLGNQWTQVSINGPDVGDVEMPGTALGPTPGDYYEGDE
jgi:protocatechuate 3,4-dioxygenase beta subunit